MHQIRYFLAVCETLNFTRAAEACNVSQPSLTRAIKGLEDELGGPLFRRERNNTHLTGLGEMMRPHLTQVLIETDAAKERAKSFAKLDDVELKLGMMCTIGPRRFVPFLQAFRERHPKVNLIVKDGSSGELQERLAQGELDVAVYGQPEEIDERFHARRLYDERFVVGVGPGHPFEKQNAVRCADLHQQAYVNRVQCEYFGHAGKKRRSEKRANEHAGLHALGRRRSGGGDGRSIGALRFVLKCRVGIDSIALPGALSPLRSPRDTPGPRARWRRRPAHAGGRAR